MGSPAERWSALHHGIDPSGVPLLRAWLALMWTLARPLRRVPPTAITVTGVVLAWVAVLLAGTSPGVALVAALAAALCDGLDGAVAVLADRATRSGAVADAVADRLCDVAFAAVLWRCGAPAWTAVLAGVLAVGVDVLRRARRVPTSITAGERPTWTICAALACAGAAVSASGWPVVVCTVVWCGAGVVACVQLARVTKVA